MASSALASTLHHIARTKLQKLDGARKHADQGNQELAVMLKKQTNLRSQVVVLLEEVKKSYRDRTLPRNIQNIECFLDQARSDPSVSEAMLRNWGKELRQILSWKSERFSLTALFGELVVEWIQTSDSVDPKSLSNAELQKKGGHDDDASGDVSDSSDSAFEPVGRNEMYEQRKQWEDYAFKTKETDPVAVKQFLEGLFAPAYKSKKINKTPLELLREHITDFTLPRFTSDGVKLAIKALLKADLFSGDKRRALEDLNRKEVLSEIADVLNQDLNNLDLWQWEGPVPLVMRRQTSGKYRVFMDEEIYQAIFLQYIGIHWAVHLKTGFNSFFRSGAWLQKSTNAMTRHDRLRREYFLGPSHNHVCVRNTRREQYMENYFMTQLPSSVFEGTRDYGDDDEKDVSEDTYVPQTGKTPLETKQSMLYLATTECLVNLNLHGQFTVLQSDFKWFGPSLPHSTLTAAMEFFGFDPRWLKFFDKYMKASVYFAQESPSSAQERKRGMPMAHTLSDAIGEVIMFVLDFSVNQRTQGSNVYRFHDDLWFFGVPETCATAWVAMNDFAKVMGLELNEEKTGSVVVGLDTSKNTASTKAPDLSVKLPSGRVKWGFLVMDSSGRWEIDQTEVDGHIVELKRQLAACGSVFAYVEAFNAYVAKFFLNNFAWPAQCLGRGHIDMCITTLRRIQRELFGSDADGNIATHLRRTIAERFPNSGAEGLPDGFFYFPSSLGGLGLVNPMIKLVGKRTKAAEKPNDIILENLEREEDLYQQAKQKFEDGKVTGVSSAAEKAVHGSGAPSRRGQKGRPRPSVRSTAAEERDEGDDVAAVAGVRKGTSDDDGDGDGGLEQFMSFEEFTRFREETSVDLNRAYEQLTAELDFERMTTSGRVTDALHADQARTQIKDLVDMSFYQAWVTELYGQDVVDKCGQLVMGEVEYMPIGLLTMLRSERFRWVG